MKRLYGTAIAALFVASPVLAQQLPPAKPGECYAKVLIPAAYESSSEEVLVEAGSDKLTKTDAVYRTVEKSVLVAEETYELEVVPATYESVTKTILVRPEEVVQTLVPASYGSQTKDVLVSPAHVVWKVGRGLYEKIDTATGEIMCRVEVPAVYKTVSQKMVSTPASTVEKVVPAKYMTVETKVMKTPPSTVKKTIPAVYETITVEELVTPEKVDKTVIPPVYNTVTKTALVTPESVQWRQVLCETNTTPDIISRIQKALVSKGYRIGTIDGDFGPATRNAVSKFQTASGLPTGGLTLSTVKALGLQ